MLKDFIKTKNQLKELATVLNSFKSEAVQLKIIELLLQNPSDETEHLGQAEKIIKASAGLKKRGRPRKEEAPISVKIAPKRTRRKIGPTQVLRLLMNEKFFNSKRAIGDIVKYSNDKMKLPLKSNDFSGILMNYIRLNKLKREKNPETGQFEYIYP